MSDKVAKAEREKLPPHNDLLSFLATIRAFGVLADELIKVADNYKLPISFKVFVGGWIKPLRAASETAEALLEKYKEPPCPK